MKTRPTRRLVLAAPVALAACGLAERPYAERRDWPLDPRRPSQAPPRAGGQVLLVRMLRAGPGLEARGLQSVQPDGSIRTAFYEEWAVPPAQAAEDALRRWLAASGLFAAVTAPGSRLPADLALEGELTALWTLPAEALARAALAITVLEQHPDAVRVRLQRTFTATAPLLKDTPPDDAAAMVAAMAGCLGQVEAALAAG